MANERRGVYVGSLSDPPAHPSSALFRASSGAVYVPEPGGKTGWLLSAEDRWIEARPADASARLRGLETPFRRERMDRPAPTDVTGLLRVWADGDDEAFDRLMPLVYDELHRMALRCLAGERSNVSLQPTALVNEICLRLLGWDPIRWQNRGHFFGVSAQMMRRVLVDIARRRNAERRGGAGAVRISLEEIDLAAQERDTDLVAVDEALARLAAEDPRKARVVELRFFGGLTMEETAQALGVSLRTVHNDWAFARAWLYRELSGRSVS